MALEIEIEWEVVCRARRAGWFVQKLRFDDTNGAPDRIFIKDGRVVFIEFKAPEGRLRGIQKKVISEMRGAGAEVHVAYSAKWACKILEIDDAEA